MALDPVSAALEVAKTGPVLHAGPGRTDDVEASVPGESFVIPADIVSAIGDGNTAHGMTLLDHMFPRIDSSGGEPVPVVLAGGEYVIDPKYVSQVGKGDVQRGHNELSKWVKLLRQQAIKTLQKLPGPVKA